MKTSRVLTAVLQSLAPRESVQVNDQYSLHLPTVQLVDKNGSVVYEAPPEQFDAEKASQAMEHGAAA